MRLTARAARLFHTVRYLKPAQFGGRFRRLLPAPRLSKVNLPTPRQPALRLQPREMREASMTGPATFRFLNIEAALPENGNWDPEGLPRLWRYNLHYFDDLNAVDASQRDAWHRDLVRRWIRENPPCNGTGWEPYPISIRIVNWIKWMASGREIEPAWIESLALQARWLAANLEYHLLGNHLFVNAKALMFAGCYFSGTEAEAWRNTAAGILLSEIDEQILEDGGQFERSPMYHCLATEDLLDIISLGNARPHARLADVADKARRTLTGMLTWMQRMTHPDGEIALFNDSAFAIAPTPAALIEYADALAIPAPEPAGAGLHHLPQSGYAAATLGPAYLIADIGEIGPDYIPGHAHADTLSFELSLFGARFIVDSGCSTYVEGPERLRQRGTQCHNTIAIAGQDSSEVWGGFRVARRARPFDVSAMQQNDRIRISAAHDGYRRLRNGPAHRRQWCLSPGRLEIHDELDTGIGGAVARLHFHPDVTLESDAERTIAEIAGRRMEIRVSGGVATLEHTTWHPEFGVSLKSRALSVSMSGQQLTTTVTWD